MTQTEFPFDSRYDYVTCAGCGDSYQRIDFHAHPHAFFCQNREEIR